MGDAALQELMPHKTCFGCGTENSRGLGLKTYWNGEEGVCIFEPLPYMIAAPGVVNGGIIATLIDCHCVSTAMAHLYQVEGRAFGSGPGIWCVTASLHVDYRRPTPSDQPIELRARVTGEDQGRLTVSCVLRSDGKERAHGTVVAVRVMDSRTEASRV